MLDSMAKRGWEPLGMAPHVFQSVSHLPRAYSYAHARATYQAPKRGPLGLTVTDIHPSHCEGS